MEETTSKYLTAEQAAEYVQVSADTIYKALRRKELKGVLMGTRKGWRTTLEWLDVWVASKVFDPTEYRRSA